MEARPENIALPYCHNVTSIPPSVGYRLALLHFVYSVRQFREHFYLSGL